VKTPQESVVNAHNQSNLQTGLAGTGVAPTTPQMRCLVVDDLPDDRALLERMLRRSGYRTTLLADGRSALSTLRDQHFDVALVDLGMTSMSGAEVIREIRRQDRSIRILVVSGFDDHGHILEALEAGANGYILKDELGERLGSALQDVFAGGSPLSSRVGSVVLRHAFARGRTSPLSPGPGVAVAFLKPRPPKP
jgi:DNA-binding NarL/FixJ family response regulator